MAGLIPDSSADENETRPAERANGDDADDISRGTESSDAISDDQSGNRSTGITVLDRKLDGGIPAGSMIAFCALPASQSELFLYDMAGVRETVYLTTERSVAAIESALETVDTPLDAIEIKQVPDADVEALETALAGVPEEATLIVDTANPLESAGREDYRAVLSALSDRTVETGGLTILHCLKGRSVPAQRDRTEYFADVVFDLSTRMRGDSVENRLAVPKFRGGRSLPEAIELDLTSDVTIDVSRKIA